MNKEFIPYEESLALKELGFDEPCFGYYKDGRMSGVSKWDRKDWEFHVLTNKEITNLTSEIILAPTYSQAFRWFRENHDLIHRINRDGGWWICAILDLYDEDDQGVIENFIDCNPKTYEEAELECLKKLIEKIK
jgi:hypothetical protein